MKTINNLKAATIAVTLALGAITFNAMAEESFNAEVQTNQQPLVGVFTKLDVSADGLLTRKEAAKDKLFSRKHFNKADLDHDFTLDQEEYSNYKSAAQTHKTQQSPVLLDKILIVGAVQIFGFQRLFQSFSDRRARRRKRRLGRAVFQRFDRFPHQFADFFHI